MSDTARSLSLPGAVALEARNVWARLAKGRGHAGFCLWPVGPQSRTGPLPLEDIPAASKGRFGSTLAGYSRKPGTLLPSPREKCFVVVFSQGPCP